MKVGLFNGGRVLIRYRDLMPLKLGEEDGLMKQAFSGENGQPSRHGPFAQDAYAGLITVGVESVLTIAGAAASRYVEGNFSRAEDFHAQAELAYTRLTIHLARFGQRADCPAPDEDLKRAQTALDRLWLLHRTAA